MCRRLVGTTLTLALCLIAQTPNTVFIEDLTWPEVRNRIKAGSKTVLVPTGGTEQNGPHLVLGKHNYRVRYLAQQVAQRLGNTLVAPILPYAPASAHMKYAGTIDLPPAEYVRVLEQVARSLKQHGFTDIVILIDSGVAREVMFAFRDAINKEWAQSDARVLLAPTFLAAEQFDRWLMERGETNADIGVHGGLAATSLMMAIDPRHVRSNKLTAKDEQEGSVDGNPARASAAYGRKGLELMIEAVVRRIGEARDSSRKLATE